MLFEQFKLNTNILRGIHANGYMLPTPLQQELIPAALSGRDVFACAGSGSGKTAAYTLPALQVLQKKGFTFSTGPRVIILSPSRTSVLQTGKLVKQLGKYVRFHLSYMAQGLSNAQQQEHFLDQETDILVTTPQRILSAMESGRLDFNRLELLVFDEAQEIAEAEILQISRSLSRQKQTLILSSEEKKSLDQLAGRILQKPNHIRVESGQNLGRSLRHYLYACDDERHKVGLFKRLLLEKEGQVCVVVSDIAKTEDIKAQLQDESIKCCRPSRDYQERRGKLTRGSDGKVLILTNTETFRGVYIRDVVTLIHYDVPQYPEQYIQRVAPLAQNQQGVAIILALAADANSINSIEHLMGYHFTFRTIDGLEPQQPFYRPKIKLKRDHLGRIIRRPNYSQDDNRRPAKRNSKQKSGHLRMLRRAPKNHS